MKITNADYHEQALQGGTIGNVRLISGIAETSGGEKLPYKVVWKTTRKFERPGDFNSWRREYDLYISDFDEIFSDSFGWAECYHAEINENEAQIELWLEYIDGVSGEELTAEMLEQAAVELGHFQGKLYKNPEILKNIDCLSDAEAIFGEHAQWHNQAPWLTYEYLISDECWKEEHLQHIRQTIKNNHNIWNNSKSFEHNYLRLKECAIPEHLKKMLIEIDDNAETIFANIKQNIPGVLCHRDFWHENIFYIGGKIKLIDWDCVGWGYMGEDIASLIEDNEDKDIENLHEYYRRFIPAYYRGLSEYMDISAIENLYIYELIVIKFGYRVMQKYIFAKTDCDRNQAINRLQKIYEMKDIKLIL